MKKTMFAGLAGIALVMGATACGGDDGGTPKSEADIRAALTKAIKEGQDFDDDTVTCLVDAAFATFNDADMQAVLKGKDPSEDAQSKYIDAAMNCGITG